MNGDSAYEGEMNEVALFESALRAAVPTRPDPRLAIALVPRLAETARASTIEAETHATRRRPRSRSALVARVGIAVGLIPLVLAGLAFAGVTVPAPARSAFDAVGISLPNQPATAGHGTTTGQGSSEKKNAGETTTTTSEGKSKGKGNSKAAHQHALEQRAKAQGNAVGHGRGKAIGLNGSTPPGQAKAPNPPPHSNAGGNSATHTTTHTPPAPPTPTPPGNANGHSK